MPHRGLIARIGHLVTLVTLKQRALAEAESYRKLAFIGNMSSPDNQRNYNELRKWNAIAANCVKRIESMRPPASRAVGTTLSQENATSEKLAA
jgi:hypothetical protein